MGHGAGGGRVFGRLGLFWQLLIPFVVAITMSVIAVQYWTLRVSQATLEQRMQGSLSASMALLKAYLAPLGTEWSRENGQLRLGSSLAAAQGALVDQAGREAGSLMTIFDYDERAATTVRKPDGQPATGTKLTDPAVVSAVLQQGHAYRGSATILGQAYLTQYEPIRDRTQKIVGILFTGLPVAELEAAKATVLHEAVAAGISVVLVCALVEAGLLTLMLRPLNGLTTATLQIAGGALETAVPHAGRRDQIGRLAQALGVLKNNGLQARQAEEEQRAAQERRASEDERVRREAELAAAADAAALVVGSIGMGLDHLAAGDLTFRLRVALPADYEKLRSDLNKALDQLETVIRSIVTNTLGLSSGTADITRAADDLSRRTEQQAASLKQTAAALDQITATIRKMAESAKQAYQIVARTRADAERSGGEVRQAVAAMSGIEQSSQQIAQIIGVIDEIAFQTNLLALNAGVEAARAGDAGRGFAVVATEVRALAERSAQAAKEIKTLIAKSTRQVGDGVRLVGETGAVLGRIAGQVIEITTVVSDIAAMAEQQALGLHEVNSAVTQMDQVTQQNAAMVEESAVASHALARETAALVALTKQFQIGGDELPARSPAAAVTVGRSRPPALRVMPGGHHAGRATTHAKPEKLEQWEEH